ncbi:MAG: hypothetical protein ABW166_16415 [Sedimenticola sp.]
MRRLYNQWPKLTVFLEDGLLLDNSRVGHYIRPIAVGNKSGYLPGVQKVPKRLLSGFRL